MLRSCLRWEFQEYVGPPPGASSSHDHEQPGAEEEEEEEDSPATDEEEVEAEAEAEQLAHEEAATTAEGVGDGGDMSDVGELLSMLDGDDEARTPTSAGGGDGGVIEKEVSVGSSSPERLSPAGSKPSTSASGGICRGPSPLPPSSANSAATTPKPQCSVSFERILEDFVVLTFFAGEA